jgi:hypothetical protein
MRGSNLSNKRNIEVDLEVLTPTPGPAGKVDFFYTPTTNNVSLKQSVTFVLGKNSHGGTFRIIFEYDDSPFAHPISDTNPTEPAIKKGTFKYIVQITLPPGRGGKTYTDRGHCPTIIVN